MGTKEYTKKYGLCRWYKITDVAELLNDLNSLHDFLPISVEETRVLFTFLTKTGVTLTPREATLYFVSSVTVL